MTTTAKNMKSKLIQLFSEEDGVVVEDTKQPITEVKVSVSAVPDGKETWISKPPTKLLQLGESGLMGNMSRVFRLRMTRAATLTTGGGGTMNLATFLAPSQFDQYTQVGSLFQFARIKRLAIEYQNLISPSNSTALPALMAIGYCPNNVASITPTFSETVRLPNSRLVSSCQTNWPQRLEVKLPKLPFSSIAGGASGTDPIGGTPGQFFHCINGAVSGTTTYFAYLIVADFEFKFQQ